MGGRLFTWRYEADRVTRFHVGRFEGLPFNCNKEDTDKKKKNESLLHLFLLLLSSDNSNIKQIRIIIIIKNNNNNNKVSEGRQRMGAYPGTCDSGTSSSSSPCDAFIYISSLVRVTIAIRFLRI